MNHTSPENSQSICTLATRETTSTMTETEHATLNHFRTLRASWKLTSVFSPPFPLPASTLVILICTNCCHSTFHAPRISFISVKHRVFCGRTGSSCFHKIYSPFRLGLSTTTEPTEYKLIFCLYTPLLYPKTRLTFQRQCIKNYRHRTSRHHNILFQYSVLPLPTATFLETHKHHLNEAVPWHLSYHPLFPFISFPQLQWRKRKYDQCVPILNILQPLL